MDKFNYSLNNERLKRYIVNNKADSQDVIGLYLWNIRLSKELYPLISLVEITLRNHINNAISQNIAEKWLLNKDLTASILKDKELLTYYDAYKELDKRDRLTEGRLIAELSLGFWVNLFNKKYKVNLWHKKNVFETTFPYFNIKAPDRIGYVFPKLKEIQYVRNRISHHEAIFDYPKGLQNCHNDIMLLLEWLSPEIKDLSAKVSNFTEEWQEKSKLKKLAE